MGIIRTDVDGGSDTPKEDYPWRPLPFGNRSPHSTTTPQMLSYDILTIGQENTLTDWQQQAISINPASCLMAGLDLTAKLPICGLGVPFLLSELDFVWLAVYFDSNLRPMHAGIQKGPRHTRWYEYGGISMGGFPRAIKTVRRDHIGVDVGAIDADGYAKPDVYGPEYDYVAHEVDKEIEMLSHFGFLNPVNSFSKLNARGNFKKALQSELTYFLTDPIQVKQFAAFTLLGYCTSTPPDAKYPYPHTKHIKTVRVGGNTPDVDIPFYYRQTCTDHLMLTEANAGGVRACHIVPGFSPYIETLPHPVVHSAPGLGGAAGGAAGPGCLMIKPSNGIEGTLPPIVVNANQPPAPPAPPVAAYIGTELAHGNNRVWNDSPNVKARMPLPGENAFPSQEAAPVLGWNRCHLWWKKEGKNYHTSSNLLIPGANLQEDDHDGLWHCMTHSQRVDPGNNAPPDHGGAGMSEWWMLNFDCDTLSFYVSKERCNDSEIVTLVRKEMAAPLPDAVAYAQEGGDDLVFSATTPFQAPP